jgi:oxygen-independent coproporphyrinogen-3 oxidase
MTAFPGLTQNRYQDSLEQVVSLNPEHISCYTLILEKNTEFYQRYKKGEFFPLNSDQEADFYEMTRQILEKAGYIAYEISNFAREEHWYCQHNLKYWQHIPYIGLGPSAHSFISPYRWKNHSDLTHYVEDLRDNRLPEDQREKLSEKTLEFEFIFLHLRLRQGLNILEYFKRFQKNFTDIYSENLKALFSSGLVEQEGDFLRLSRQGWLLADEIASSF